jgi:cyclophilin family peptidyl-prolyl cis-trans isomerase
VIPLELEEVGQVSTAADCAHTLSGAFDGRGANYVSSEDEIHPELRLTGAGILAMANSGPNTNGEPV